MVGGGEGGGGGCVGIVVTIEHEKSNTMFPGSLMWPLIRILIVRKKTFMSCLLRPLVKNLRVHPKK